ncbi:MAG: hypothetical protein AAFP89_05805 [Bacteroidota bacterium]
MKEEDKLVEYIKDKLASEPPVYQDAFWEEAQEQMAVWDAEARRRRPFLLWVLLPLLFLGVGLGTWILWPETPLVQEGEAPLATVSSTDAPSLAPNQTQPLLPPSAYPRPRVNPRPRVRKMASGQTSPVDPPPFTPVAADSEVEDRPEKKNAFTPVEEIVSKDQETENQEAHLQFSSMIFPERTVVPMPDARFRDENDFVMPKLSRSYGTFTPFRKVQLRLKAIFALSETRLSESNESVLHRQNRLGVGLTLPLGNSRKWNIMTGLEYETLPLSGLQVDSIGTVYDFASQSTQIQWEPQRASRLHVPLHIQRRLFPGHQVTIGVGIHYLLGTKGQFTQNVQRQGGEVVSESQTLSGITYGLRQWDVSPQIGYEIQVANNVHIGLQYQWGMVDFTQDQIWKQEQKDRWRQLQFTLNYRLR